MASFGEHSGTKWAGICRNDLTISQTIVYNSILYSLYCLPSKTCTCRTCCLQQMSVSVRSYFWFWMQSEIPQFISILSSLYSAEHLEASKKMRDNIQPDCCYKDFFSCSLVASCCPRAFCIRVQALCRAQSATCSLRDSDRRFNRFQMVAV